jgi:ribosomal protein S28E/S33
LIFFSIAIDVESLSIKFILFPISHVHILIGEGINSFSAAAVLVLANVLSSVRIGDFLVLRFETARVIKKLG